MALHYLQGFIRVHLYIGNLFLAGLHDLHNGLILAQADAAGLGYGNLVRKSAGLYLLGKSVKDRSGACRNSAGSHANHNPDMVVVLSPEIYLALHPVSDCF